MIDELQVFLIFCEDIRKDDGGKPMLIGVLSPVFVTSPNPGVGDEVQLVTFVHAPHQIEEVALKLELSFSGFGSQDRNTVLSTKLHRPNDTNPSDPWAAYLPLPVTVEEWRDGSVVGARLTANDVAASAQLTCRMETEPAPAVKRKPRKRIGAVPA